MYKKAFLLVFLLLATSFAFAQATFKEIVGKVEVKTETSAWLAARVGMKISPGTIIATGFNAKAVLELDGSVLYVKQLTRLTLAEIARSQGVITTNIYLQTGSLEAEVKKGSDYSHDYKVRSPVSTAAVRGTVIRFDGFRLDCQEGRAQLINILGQSTTAFAGQTCLTHNGLGLTEAQNYLQKLTEVLLNRGLIPSTDILPGSDEAIVIPVPIFGN